MEMDGGEIVGGFSWSRISIGGWEFEIWVQASKIKVLG